MLMPANFSSLVGEFMVGSIPHHCPTLVKNRYDKGHADLIPRDRFTLSRMNSPRASKPASMID